MEFKLNIGNPKTGKTYKKDVAGDEAKEYLHKKIGDKVKGDKAGFSGYEFEITGGSDSSGFPMRKDVSGTARKKILIAKGVGTRHTRKGIRLRRSVAANTIYAKTTQINLKVLKEGKTPLGGAAVEEATPEPAKEKKTEKPKKEEKKEKKKEEVNKKEDKKEAAPKKEDKKEAKEKPKADEKKE